VLFVIVTPLAFYGTARGRRYGHATAIRLAIAGTLAAACFVVAAVHGIPLFGFDLGPRPNGLRRRVGWLLTGIAAAAIVVVLVEVITKDR
jgi:hypothetical protein